MLDYGIIGNCHTCALVSKKASIEWFCFPHFSSSSVFAKILDRKSGGSFEIKGVGKYKTRQRYLTDTNILETTFESDKESFQVLDFFPRYRKIIPNKKRKIFTQNRLIRIIKPIKGRPIIKVRYDPKMNYATGKDKHELKDRKIITSNRDSTITLITNVGTDTIMEEHEFVLNHTKYFIIGVDDDVEEFNVKKCYNLLTSTKKYWRKWVGSLVLPEKNRDLIIRSALVLKLLTFSQTGAIIAAATTSIPEESNSERTWDYRYCWVRDASFTADALKKIGRKHEAKRLMEFIFNNTVKEKKSLRLMYDIFGNSDLTEKNLEHLQGYKGCKPVRVGNAAYHQKQNDIYGSIIDVLYLYFIYYKYEKKMPEKYWRMLRYLVSEIKNNWHRPDHGIWEFRGITEHFTYSKLMCYVGVDRAIKIAQHFGREKAALDWSHLRDEIGHDIMKKNWSEKKQSFTIHPNSDDMDAALLMMSYHDFLPNDDPRTISTIKQIDKELANGALVQRYKIKDDFGKSKSSFTICSFWLIDALYRIGETKKAEKIFKQLNRYSNHLGLFSEDIDIKSRNLMGNFPQAYTHIALINSAILLSEWSSKRKEIFLENNFPF